MKKCEDGFLRNEKNRCTKIKKPKINTNTSKKLPSKTKEEISPLLWSSEFAELMTANDKKCLKQNKDYNRLTKKCTKKCKNNQIRNKNFKCVTNKKKDN